MMEMSHFVLICYHYNSCCIRFCVRVRITSVVIVITSVVIVQIKDFIEHLR